MFNDPSGLLNDAQWNDFLKRLHSGNFGEFGGYYKTGGSDQFTEYRSEDEAFGFAAWEMNYNYGWGSYRGWATSFAHALSRYTRLKKGANLKGVLAGVVAAYFTNQWRGEASNITANHSYENKVDGFAISITINGNRYNNTYFVSENFIRGTFAFLNSLYNGQKDGNTNWWSIGGNINASMGVTLESTEQIVITSQRLANRFSGTTNKIIKGGRFAKNAGTGLAVAGGLITIGDAVANGVQLHHAADLAIDAGIYALSASIPVAGWIVGGAWFLGNIAFQHYHNGQSITEYYLDK